MTTEERTQLLADAKEWLDGNVDLASWAATPNEQYTHALVSRLVSALEAEPDPEWERTKKERPS